MLLFSIVVTCIAMYLWFFFTGWRLTLLEWRQIWSSSLQRYALFRWWSTHFYMVEPIFVCLFQITSVQSRSDTVNTSLFDKRENIEKLHRTRNLLRKVQVCSPAYIINIRTNDLHCWLLSHCYQEVIICSFINMQISAIIIWLNLRLLPMGCIMHRHRIFCWCGIK
jgi:hypothetical protein